jgi:probable HAF family extracellular repeat protein
VGLYTDANNVNHGFVLLQGQYTTLDDPNAGTGAFHGTLAFGINASGKIVGNYTDANGAIHGFLATPQHGNVLLGAAGNPDPASDNVSMPIAIAAPDYTTSLGTLVVSVASTAGATPGDGLGDRSSGQTTAIVTVPSPARWVVDPGVTLNGAHVLWSRLVFGLKVY